VITNKSSKFITKILKSLYNYRRTLTQNCLHSLRYLQKNKHTTDQTVFQTELLRSLESKPRFGFVT